MAYKDPEKRREYQRHWIAKRRSDWIEANGPCPCGSTEDLEVDHIDAASKLMNPASIWGRREEARLAELAKCQVLCKRCHVLKSLPERARGTQVWTSKFTEEEVLSIKRSTEPTKILAERYQVNRRTIQHIRAGSKWKHISLS